jgi:hypothetical protein
MHAQVLGHEAFGGSVCLLFPLAHTSIAITTNNATLDKTHTRTILSMLAKELELPLPSFVKD